LIVSLFVFCLLSSPLLAEDAPQAEPSESAGEADVQKALREEALKLEIEMARAEREGGEAVYEVRVKRTKKLAEKANQTKSLSDVLIFEKVANQTLDAFSIMNEKRIRQAWADRGSRPGDGSEALIQKAIDLQYQQEKAGIEGFLDESLRGK
jgi:hypothetical protein